MLLGVLGTVTSGTGISSPSTNSFFLLGLRVDGDEPYRRSVAH